MGMNLPVRDLILNGETTDRTFRQVILDAHAQGWQTFDQALATLYREGVIDEEMAKTWASDRAHVTGQIDQFRASRGEETSSLGALEMETTRQARG